MFRSRVEAVDGGFKKKDFPQDKVISIIFFNVYINYQPIGEETQHFAHADDLSVMA